MKLKNINRLVLALIALNIVIWLSIIYVVIGTFWLLVTVPSGAEMIQQDGHCYRVESRSFGPVPHMSAIYWEVSCP